jgi:CheY-like chemotaxis protein
MQSAPPDSANEQLLQVLSALVIQVNALQTLVNEEAPETSIDAHAIRDGLSLLERMAREALYVARVSLDDVSPAELADSTLADALSRLVDETAEMLSISSRVSFSGVDDEERSSEHTLSPLAERTLYAIARESLYQVQQHSGARKLRLALNYGTDDVQMSIEDDGINPALSSASTKEIAPASGVPPFAEAPVVLSVPLITKLRQRIEQYGGTLEIAAAGERGTRVLVHIPYAPHTHTPSANADIPLLAEDAPAVATAADEVVRILVVDGQSVTRAGLHRLLESYAGLQVVGLAADGVQAVSETLELGPRVVLMDAQLPNGQSLEALRQIKQLNLDTRVLLLSTLDRVNTCTKRCALVRMVMS